MAIGTDWTFQPEGPTNATPSSGPVQIMGTATDTCSWQPATDQTALTAGLIVERDPAATRFIQLAGNASVTVRGILTEDQFQNVDNTYNVTKALCVATHGPVRVLSGQALNADTAFCSDATGRARPWLTGVDPGMSYLGTIKETCTAAGDAVEAYLERGG